MKIKEKYVVKVTSKGQLTLPKTLRETFAIGKGSKVILELRKEEIALKPRRVSIVEKLKGLGKPSKSSLEWHKEFEKEWERRLRR
ncbi:MAG: AbrB/MazE/SpoVT family DNA-binding domain-containing protein [Euryarchaeota archaeon]|nr:AbrB/MazE/SpoVT family DNA-binding domain-containing protein [Euryarchaeota archaeon]